MLVSVVIPCYNHGEYLDDALNSVLENATGLDLEIIIVNDGSNEAFTNSKIKELENRKHVKVLWQKNLGLAKARNNGINVAKGKYILPLDADNLLTATYFTKGLEILEKNEEIAIIYGDSIRFGLDEGIHSQNYTDYEVFFQSNLVDACSIYRRDLWVKVNGYDEAMPYAGAEDWEFWVKCLLAGANFKYINEICYHYRVRNDSMFKTITEPNLAHLKYYILRKHHFEIIEFLLKNNQHLKKRLEFKSISMASRVRYFIKRLLLKEVKRSH